MLRATLLALAFNPLREEFGDGVYNHRHRYVLIPLVQHTKIAKAKLLSDAVFFALLH